MSVVRTAFRRLRDEDCFCLSNTCFCCKHGFVYRHPLHFRTVQGVLAQLEVFELTQLAGWARQHLGVFSGLPA